ncbi:Virus attachment protein p12 family, partial [Dysosmobacter welbionis]
ADRFKACRLRRQVQPADTGKEAHMGEAVRHGAGPRRPRSPHRRRPARTAPGPSAG